MTAELKQAIEVLKVYRQGNITVSHVNFIAAIDTVLSSINSGNKTGLDDRLQEKSIEVSDNQEVLSNKKDRLYTDKDMENFSVWAYNNGWYYGELTEAWYNSEQLDDTKHTIEEVIKLWEETK